jgi:hypothetical protein
MIAGGEVGLNVARPLWIPRQRIKIKLSSQPGGADGGMPPTYETMHSVPYRHPVWKKVVELRRYARAI